MSIARRTFGGAPRGEPAPGHAPDAGATPPPAPDTGSTPPASAAPDTAASPPPPDTAPASSAPPTEAKPVTSAETNEQEETVLDAFAKAISFILEGGKPTNKNIQKTTGLDADGTESVLVDLEKLGLLGPYPKPGKEREVLLKKLSVEEAAALKARYDRVPNEEMAKFSDSLNIAEIYALEIYALDDLIDASKPTTAAPPPDAEPASLKVIPISRVDQAITHILAEGRVTKKRLQEALTLTSQETDELLAHLEILKVIGPPPKPGKNREILYKEPATTDPEEATTETELTPLEVTPAEPAVGTETAWPAELDEDETPTIKTKPVVPDAEKKDKTETGEPDAQEEPDEEATSAFAGVRTKLRGAFAKFASKFRGEVQPEDEAGDKPLSEYARKGALALIGGYMTVIGYKGIHDAPAWVVQKYTTRAERKRLRGGFETSDEEAEPEAPDAITQRITRVKEAIDSSKFMTQAQKEQLRTRLDTVVADYKDKEATLRQERDEKIAKLLDKAIQTRVKGVTALKEGVNTALMLTGFMAVRAGWFGAVSLVERGIKVQKERASEVRKGGFLNELIVKGFTETAGKLAGGVPAFAKIGVYGTGAGFEWLRSQVSETESEKLDAHLKKLAEQGPKALRAMEGAATVMRIAGLGGMAIAELLETGGPSEAINAAMDAMGKKGFFGTALENLVEAPMKPIHTIGSLYDRLTGSEPDVRAGGGGESHDKLKAAASVEPGVPEARGGAAGVGAPEQDVAGANAQEASAAANMKAAAAAGGAAVAEAAPAIEVPEAQIVETGLVKKGDGILKVLGRQGVEAQDALEAAREAHIVRAGGDTRLTTQAIGRLSIFTEVKPDGELEIKFFDTQAATPGDAILTLEEAREAGFTYEHGTVPGEIPTDKEIVAQVAEPAPEPELSTDSPAPAEVLTDSDAPNDLLGGTFHLYTDDGVHFSSLDAGGTNVGDKLTRMVAALQELEDGGHGESPEAKFILQEYADLLESKGITLPTDVPTLDAAATALDEVRAREAATPLPDEVPTEHEPLHRFVGKAGKVRFVYNSDDTVKDAWMPAYTPKPGQIDSALAQWKLTRDQVMAHFFAGSRSTTSSGEYQPATRPARYATSADPMFPDMSPEAQSGHFIRTIEKLARQEAILKEMDKAGLGRTLEFARLRMETTRLRVGVEDDVEKLFPS